MAANDDQSGLIDADLIKHWKCLKKRPTVIVLDLDYTLWPFYADCHLSPPLRKLKEIDGEVEIIDSDKAKWRAFKDVTKILRTLRNHCLAADQHLAVASRSTTNMLAREAIELFGWTSYFSSIHIYPKSKLIHMKAIMEELNVKQFGEILFFDDERHTNIIPLNKAGIFAYEVDESYGLTMEALIDGLNKFGAKK